MLAQPSISSQLIDNLNASIHLRALLTDLFVVDEILKAHRPVSAIGLVAPAKVAQLTPYRRLCAAALALAAALSMVGRAQAGPGITDSTILIGVEGSTQAFASDEENLGMHLVARDVNSRGGVHGRLLDIRSYPRPASATPDDVLANVKKLVEQDGVFLIFNHGGPSAMSIAPYAMRMKVPYMFPHTALVTADADRYVFTSYPRYLGESQVMLRYLSETRGFKRIGIVHDANVYGRIFSIVCWSTPHVSATP